MQLRGAAELIVKMAQLLSAEGEPAWVACIAAELVAYFPPTPKHDTELFPALTAILALPDIQECELQGHLLVRPSWSS